MAMEKAGFSGSRIGQELLHLYRLLQAKGKKAAAEVKRTALDLKGAAASVFDPLAVTPEGFALSASDDRKRSDGIPQELNGVQIAYLQATGSGSGVDVEKILWRYVAVKGFSEDASYRAMVHRIVKDPTHRFRVQGFLHKALHDMVTQLEIATMLETTPVPGRGLQYSQSTQVWDIAATFYLYIEDFDHAIEFSRKLCGSSALSRTTRLEYEGVLGGALNFKAKKLLKEGQALETVRPLFEEAKKHLETACRGYDGPEIGWYGCLIETNSYIGRGEDSWHFIRQALRQFGATPSVLVSYILWCGLLDIVMHNHGKTPVQIDEAVRLFERVEGHESALPPGNRDQFMVFRHLMGIVYCIHGEYDKAISYLQQKVNWDTDPQCVFHMAFAQAKKGNTAEAERLLEVLQNLDSRFRGLNLLRAILAKPQPAPRVASPAPALKPATPAPPPPPSPFISGEDFKKTVVGESGSNIERILTGDRAVRRARAAALESAVRQYVDHLNREDWEAVQSLYLSQPVTLAAADPNIRSILDILGIEKIEIHLANSREVRVFVSGYPDKYYRITIHDNLTFDFAENPPLREIESLLRAVILEEIVAITEQGSSFGLVADALKAQPKEAPATEVVDWAALGRAAKAERDEAARQAAAAAAQKAEEEARLLAQLEQEQGITAERDFLAQNRDLYSGVSSAVDAAGINLVREEFSTDNVITTCMSWIGRERAIDAPVLSFDVPVPGDHILYPVVKRITIYGPIRGREVLARKNLRPETIAELGFKDDAPKSAFLGVYDLECVVEGRTKTLTAILDPSGQKLVILGLPEQDEQGVLSKTLRRVVLERLAYRTARMVIDRYSTDEAEGVRTEGAEILYGIALTIEREMGPVAGRQGKKQSIGHIGSAAERMELLRIASQPGGISREPLYVKRSGSGYRRVRSDDAHYRSLIVYPPDKRFVRVRSGMTYRLRLGPTNTPGARNPAKHEPYYWALNMSAEGQITVTPDWNPLTWERIFGVGNAEYKAKALMPYTIEKGKREAYLFEGANRLEADLAPSLMVYAVTAYQNDKLVYIPRDVSARSIDDVQAQLQGKPAQVDFLQKFMAGEIDVLAHAGISREERREYEDAGVKKRFLIVMPTNVGFWEGRFWSHEQFQREEAKLQLASLVPMTPV